MILVTQRGRVAQPNKPAWALALFPLPGLYCLLVYHYHSDIIIHLASLQLCIRDGVNL